MNRHLASNLLITLALLAALNSLNADAIEFKGANYVAWGWDIYSTPGSDESLANAKDAGCAWVALNVFWFQDTVTSAEIYPDSWWYSASTGSVMHAIDTCHELGIRVMLKPMVDVKSGEWRARIVPSTAWFTEYQQFMDYWADVAEFKNVEMLCIGCEFIDTTTWADSWRSIAANTRTRYTGPLTYAANHGNEQNIDWWDALDYIGIDAYYPLTDHNDATLNELKLAWQDRANSIQSWRWTNWPTHKIIFTEVGYGSFDGANRYPWAGSSTAPVDLAEQADCYTALLSQCANRSWFAGVFWWMWETNPNAGGPTDKGHTPQHKPAEQILTDYYITITGDLNDDHTVNVFDLELFTNYWPEPNAVGLPDFNNDKKIDAADFAIFASNWRQSAG